MMNKQKILNAAQKHGDLAFNQGYEAALLGIDKNDREKLSKMPEGRRRLDEFKKLWDALKVKIGGCNGNI
jgi:hypothetical protein